MAIFRVDFPVRNVHGDWNVVKVSMYFEGEKCPSISDIKTFLYFSLTPNQHWTFNQEIKDQLTVLNKLPKDIVLPTEEEPVALYWVNIDNYRVPVYFEQLVIHKVG